MNTATTDRVRICRALSFFVLSLITLAFSSQAFAGLTVAASAAPDPVRPGDWINVEYTVANDGMTDLFSVTVTTEVPPNVSSVAKANISDAGDCPGGACEVGETITWTIGTVASGDSRTVRLGARVLSGASAPADGTAIQFEAAALDGAVEQDTDSATATVQANMVLDVGVLASISPVDISETFSYTVTFGNRSAIAASPNTTLSLTLPSEVNFVSASDGGVHSAGTVTWSLGTLPPGAGGRRMVAVTVDSGALDGASLKAIAGLTNTAVPASVASDTEVTSVSSDAPLPLTLTVVADRDPVEPGETILIDYIVTNTSSSDIFGVQLVSPYPNHMNSLGQTWISDGGGCNNSTCTSGEFISWNLGTVSAGSAKVVTIRPLVTTSASLLPPDGSVIPFVARASATTVGTVESGINLLTKDASLLSVEVFADKDPVPAGDNLTYTISYGNRSLSSVTPGTTLDFTLPAGTTFVSANLGGAESGGVVQWSLGNVPPGRSAQREVVVAVDALADNGTPLVTEVVVKDASNPTNLTRRRFATIVDSGGPLEVQISTVPGQMRKNRYLPVELMVTNKGLSDLFNVVLEMRVPYEVFDFNIGAFTTGQPTCSVTCNTYEFITWNIGTLAAGAGESNHVTLRMLNSAVVEDGVVVDISARASDGLGETSRSKTTVNMETDRKLDISISGDTDPVLPGGQLLYSVMYGNRDQFSVVPNSVLSVALPDGVTFVEASPGGVHSGGVVNWPVGSLSPGASGQQLVLVTVDQSVDAGSILHAKASITDVSIPANHNRASELTRVAGSPEGLTVTLDTFPDPVARSQTLGAEVLVTNESLSDLFNVTLDVALPNDISSLGLAAIMENGSCAASTCTSGEVVSWNIGTLPAGGGVTRRVPMAIVGGSTGPTDGSLLNLKARVSDGLGRNASVRRTAVVDTSPVLTMAVEEQAEPIPGTCRLDYRVSIGNPSASTSSPSSTVALALPPETQFLSATGGGTFSNGAVVWDLGNLGPSLNGEALVTVRVPPQASDGTDLRAEGTIIDVAVPQNSARGRAATRVDTSGPLAVRATASPNPVEPGQAFDVKYNVTNTSGSTLFGVILIVQIPDFLNTIFNASIDGGGTCPGGSCTTREFMTWNIGSLAARSTFTGSFTATVRTSTPPSDGSLVRFPGFASDGLGEQASAATVIRVGSEAQEIAIDQPTVILTEQVADQNTNAADEMIVLKQPWGAAIDVEMRDGATGALLSSFAVHNSNWRPIDMTAVAGFDANPGPELAVLAVNDAGQLRIEQRDLGTGTLIANRPVLNANWMPMELNVLDNISGGPAEELVVAAVNVGTGQILQHIRDAQSDAFVRDVVFLGPAWTPLKTDVVPNYDPNPSQELTMLARNDAGKLVAMVRDAGTKAFINNVFHLGPAWTPRDFLEISDISISNNGISELVVLATNDAGRLVAMIKDASTNGFLKNVFHLGPNWEPVKLVEIPDINSSGDAELGLLAYNKCNGDAILQIRDAAAAPPDFILNVFTLTQAFTPRGLEILSVNGAPAAATLGYNGVNGAILVQVKNASNNQFIKNIKFFE